MYCIGQYLCQEREEAAPSPTPRWVGPANEELSCRSHSKKFARILYVLHSIFAVKNARKLSKIGSGTSKNFALRANVITSDTMYDNFLCF